MLRLFALLAAAAAPAAADIVVAARTLRAQELLGPADLTVKPGSIPGVLSDPALAVGQETRINVYAGRPLRLSDVGPPALVDRNQVVVLHYHRAGLAISAEGRALGRGGAGERIRVMNLSSRTTVTGVVLVDGSVSVAAGSL